MAAPEDGGDDKIDRWRPQPAGAPVAGAPVAAAQLVPSAGAAPADHAPADHAPADHAPAEDGRKGDELPEELNAAGYVGPYLFPDNARRRISGGIYGVTGVVLVALWAARHGGVLVNRGFLAGGVVLLALAAYHLLAGYRLVVRDLEALTAASSTVGFAVGHASAQLGWRGLRSRPTWRILLYSADDPPSKRGLVLVDGVDGEVVGHFVEDNPEDWSEYGS